MTKHNILIIIFIILFLTSHSSVFASEEVFSSFEEARDLYNLNVRTIEERDHLIDSFKKIHNTFKKYANEENPQAISYLGNTYQTGKGVLADYDKAIELYNNAIALGDADGKYFLAFFYLEKKVLFNKYDKARKILEEMEQGNDPRAYAGLGKIFLFGLDAKIDYLKAFEYFSKGAEAEERESMYYYGYLNMLGYGVDVNYNTAFRFLYNSEQKGFRLSYYLLSYLYTYGKGTEQNFELAQQMYEHLIPHFENIKYVNWAFLSENGYYSSCYKDFRYNLYATSFSKDLYCGAYFLGSMGLTQPDENAERKLIIKDHKWYDLMQYSAFKGCLDANIRLSEFYSIGSFVDKDLKKAAKYNKNAAKLLFLDKFEEHTNFVYLSPEEYYGRPHIIKWLKKEAAAGNEKAIAVINLLKSRKNIPGNYNWIDVDSY